ncbi:MAG: alpha/beta hydrolase [Bacteroidetes bacterium]|nr:alpha/beta hydrolase [Bacteroidota bacterium]
MYKDYEQNKVPACIFNGLGTSKMVACISVSLPKVRQIVSVTLFPSMRRLKIALLVMVALVLLALSGPKVQVETDWEEVQIPSDINAWLAASEESVPNIRPELQKQIMWADSSRTKTAVSVVYVHGFSSSRLETFPFSDSVAAALGANLYYTRLSGHGQGGDEMGAALAEEWIQDTAEAIRVGQAIGDRVILIGTSTGATLIAWANFEPELMENVAAQVWISPNFGPLDRKSEMLLWPWGRQLLHAILGDTYSYEPQNERHDISGTASYGSDVLLQMMGLVDIVRSSDLSAITIPTFMVYSPTDLVVDGTVSVKIYGEMGSAVKDSMAVLTALDTYDHVIVGDALGPENTMRVARRVTGFLKGVIK